MKNLCFVHHPSCREELDNFVSNHSITSGSAEEALRHIEKLLNIHFSQTLKFTSKHIGLAQGFGGYEVYWLHMVIPNCNLSKTQLPKVYFYKQGIHLSFLCLDSHLDNYKDIKLRKLAGVRLNEILEVLKSHVCSSENEG